MSGAASFGEQTRGWGRIRSQGARGLTGMSFSAWFSALGRPFFLPSVLSLVAFPANRHGARHPLPQPQAALPGVQIPLGKGIAASPQLGAQPEYLQAPAREMAVPSFSCSFCCFFLTPLLLFAEAKRSSCSTAGACFGKPHFHWGRKKAFLSKRNPSGAGAGHRNPPAPLPGDPTDGNVAP